MKKKFLLIVIAMCLIIPCNLLIGCDAVVTNFEVYYKNDIITSENSNIYIDYDSDFNFETDIVVKSIQKDGTKKILRRKSSTQTTGYNLEGEIPETLIAGKTYTYTITYGNFESVTIRIIVNRRENDITIKNDISREYNGEKISLSKEDYESLSNEEAIIEWYKLDNTLLEEAPSEVGTYYYKIIINETSEFESVTKTCNFSIKQAENEWIEVPNINNWTYIDKPNEPTGEVKFGEIVYQYKSINASDEEYSSAVPTEIGDYMMRASVKGNQNYKGIMYAKKFSIKKSTITEIPKVEKFKGEYSETQTLKDFILPQGFIWVDETIKPVCNQTKYKALYNNDESKYESIEVDIEIILEKAIPKYKEPDLILCYVGEVDNLEKVSFGDIKGYSWVKNQELKLGTNEYLSNYTPNDIENYKVVENISIKVQYKKLLNKPQIVGEYTYNKQGQTLEFEDFIDLLEIANESDNITQINAGKYNIIISLIDVDKYSWSDKSVEDIVLVWEILKADPEVIVPTINKQYDTIIKSLYEIELDEGFEWEANQELKSGKNEYLLMYTPNDTKNYNVLTGIKVSFDYYVVPRLATLTITLSGTTIKWTPQKLTGIKGYEIEEFKDDVTYNLENLSMTSTRNLENQKENLCGHKYGIRVKAIGDNVRYKESEWSNIFEIETITQLKTPILKSIEGGFKWDKIENATGYAIKINGSEAINVESDFLLIDNLEIGSKVSVKATGSNTLFVDSEWSTVNIYDPSKTVVQTPIISNNNVTYTGESQYVKFSGYNTNIMTLASYSSSRTQTDSGEYSYTFSLNNTDSYCWEDGSVEDVTIYWYINKALSQNPYIDYEILGVKYSPMQTLNNLSSKLPTNTNWKDGQIVPRCDINRYIAIYNQDETNYLDVEFEIIINVEKGEPSIEDIEVINGVYSPTQTLKDFVLPDNYKWKNENERPVCNKSQYEAIYNPDTINYNDKECYITIYLEKADTEYNQIEIEDKYSDEVTTLEDINLPSGYEWKHTDTILVNGENKYEVLYIPTDKVNYKTVEFEVSIMYYKVVDIPQISKKSTVYNGQSQSLLWVNYEEEYYSLRDDNVSETQINAGKYLYVLELNKTSYVWSDRTTEAIVYEWEITKAVLKKPILQNPTCKYSGQDMYVDLGSNFDTSTMEIYYGDELYGSDFKQFNTGVYVFEVRLKDANNYKWEDDTIESTSYLFTIESVTTKKPIIINSVVTFNNEYQYATFSNFDADLIDIIYNGDNYGNIFAKRDSGTYLLEVVLKDPYNTKWEDGSIDNQTYNFIIEKKSIIAPKIINNAVTYNTDNQYVNFDKNYDSEIMTVLYDNTKVTNFFKKDAGEYDLSIELNDKNNYQWIDGTTENITLKFVINKKVLPVPLLIKYKTEYNTEIQQVETDSNFDSTLMYFYYNEKNIGAILETKNAGEYLFQIRLYDNLNYQWQDTEELAINYKYTITKVKLQKPALKNAIVTYNREYQTVSLGDNFDSKLMYINYKEEKYDEYFSLRDSGKYEFTIELMDTMNYEWIDEKVEPLNFTFEIKKVKLTKPKTVTTDFTYSGAENYVEWDSNFLGEYMEIKYQEESYGNMFYQIEAGNYNIKITLLDKLNYEWLDNTNNDLSFEIIINKLKLKIPTLQNNILTYDKQEKVAEWINMNDYIIIDTDNGDATIQTEAGNYTIRLKLINTNSIVWEDNTTVVKSYKWIINKCVVVVPTINNNNSTYNGSIIEIDWSNYNEEYMIILEDEEIGADSPSQSEAGKYNIVVSLLDSNNYVWKDSNKSDNLTIDWCIKKKVVLIPILKNNNITFDGLSHEVEFENLDTNEISIPTDDNPELFQIKAGTYKYKLALASENNYVWEDGKIDAKEYEWTIKVLVLEIPTLLNPVVKYTGGDKEPQFSNYNDRFMELIIDYKGQQSLRNKGVYNIEVKLLYTESIIWSDGTTASKKYTFTIE